ncbi:MAG: MBL fold metallo-hydrolase [Candidatus Bathyarchaeota archaeon]|nr:MBL fold metallo-hydrolase [Candidatus Bathyarchaeota archaeon]
MSTDSLRVNMQEITTLSYAGVNCYLIQNPRGFFLIDTGFAKNRAEIDAALKKAGCMPDQLKLIVLTHGDFDHVGNAAYLRERFGAKIALHPADKGMVETGDLFYSRKANFLMKAMGKLILFFLSGNLKKEDRFTPDIDLEDGFDLSAFGLDAKVLHIPGHSLGSIGVLAGSGDFFCGDLLENKKVPAKNSLMPDKKAFQASIEKLKTLKIATTYPGHGKPFAFKDL